MPGFRPDHFLYDTRSILSNGWFIGGVLLLIVWMVAQLCMFTWADLSLLLPGVLISFGVVLIAETTPWTHASPPQEAP